MRTYDVTNWGTYDLNIVNGDGSNHITYELGNNLVSYNLEPDEFNVAQSNMLQLSNEFQATCFKYDEKGNLTITYDKIGPSRFQSKNGIKRKVRLSNESFTNL